MFGKYNVIYSGNQTFLVYSPNKNEEINYSQVEMFENEKYREYFLSFECTKTKQTNRIIFNITGLTALSEYIKTNLMQDQYFEIISGIQKITSFCEESSMSFDNLICNPKYMYYHYVSKKLYMAYVPLKNPHAICDSIPECLHKIHKNTKNIVITDGNYMTKYENYLNQFQVKKGKKNNTQVFSSNSLQHFFNKNENIIQPVEMTKTSHSIIDDTTPYGSEYDIGLQIANVMPPENNPAPSHSFHPSQQNQMNTHSVHPAQMNGGYNEPQQVNTGQKPYFPPSSPTVIADSSASSPPPAPAPAPAVLPDAYLVGDDNIRHDINESVFTIGREAPKSLIRTSIDTSRSHAVIEKKPDGYYIQNLSTSGGTFLNESFAQSISSAKLSDGDRIYFYRTKFTFRYVPAVQNQGSSPTVIAPASSPTFIAGSSDVQENQNDVNERPLAYLIRCSDNMSIKVTHYPFTCSAVPGIIFFNNVKLNRTVLFVQNISCSSLVFENVKNIGQGEKSEIFSGCSLYINGDKFTFQVEN